VCFLHDFPVGGPIISAIEEPLVPKKDNFAGGSGLISNISRHRSPETDFIIALLLERSFATVLKSFPGYGNSESQRDEHNNRASLRYDYIMAVNRGKRTELIFRKGLIV
jgi:hypothetical protein